MGVQWSRTSSFIMTTKNLYISSVSHTLLHAPINELYDMIPTCIPSLLAFRKISKADSSLLECPATSIIALINICAEKKRYYSSKLYDVLVETKKSTINKNHHFELLNMMAFVKLRVQC